jgi:acetyl esterase/lipase
MDLAGFEMDSVRPFILGALLMPLVAPAALAAPPLDPPSYIAGSTRITVKPTRTIRYGPSSRQQVDLYLPRGRGPFPVVMLIHGGCWSAELPRFGAIPGREHMNAVTADLLRRGVAVWNIGYRRVGEDGAAFPGTFEDVATAIDAIRDNAAGLDLNHVVIVGHSAGGHLALWATARGRLPAASPLRHGRPFLPRATVALAPWADLEASRGFVRDGCVGTDPIGPLIGSGTRPDPYADSSPMRLAPLGVPQLVVTGGHDQPELNEAARLYVERARAGGDDATLLHITESGHFELASPWTPAWPQVRSAILGLLRR